MTAYNYPFETELPATASQSALILAHAASTYPDLFNIVVRSDIKGRLNPAQFECAIVELARRHPMLRAAFVDASEGIQLIIGAREFVFHDFEDVTYSANPGSLADAVCEAERNYAFAVFEEPLFRSRLVRIAEEHHIWVFNLHHAIGDGWSGSLILEDMSSIYEAIEKSEVEATKPDPDFNFLSYIELEATYRATRRWQNDAKFWNGKATALAAAGPRSLARSQAKCERFEVLLGAPESAAIYQFCTRTCCSPNDLFMAALAIFLALKYDTFSVGVEVSVLNRPSRQLRRTVGKFVNFLPAVLTVDGKSTLASFLELVRSENRKIFRHQRYPIDRASGSHALNVQYNFQNSKHAQAFAGRSATVEWLAPSHTDRAVTVNLNDFSGNGLSLSIDRNVDVISADEAGAMSAALLAIARMIMESPDHRLGDTTLHSITGGPFGIWQAPPISRSKPFQTACLPDLCQQPIDRVAIIEDAGQWTFGMLENAVNAGADALSRAGVREGDRVCTYLPEGGRAVAAILAIWRLGATYVPVNSESPTERLVWVYRDCGSRLCVGDGPCPDPRLSWLELPQVGDVAQLRAAAPTASDLAYILYTSGTTGQPKGVGVSHGALDNYVRYFVKYFQLSSIDVVAHQASLAFDTSLEEIVPALLVGATIAVIPRCDLYDPTALWARIKETGTTVLSTVPAVLAGLNATISDPAPLRAVISGGSALEASTVKHLARATAVFNTYGPTETTICATFARVAPEMPVDLGDPVAGVSIFLLNRFGGPAIPGGSGEVVVAGAGLAQGYVGAASLAVGGFQQLALPDGTTKQIYRTGDLGRMTPNGRLSFVGRRDDQLKVGGTRVEPGEVEARLRGISGVQDAVVFVPEGADALAAVIESPQIIDKAKVVAELAASLPRHLIPSSIQYTRALPRSIAGKIDRAQAQTNYSVERKVSGPPASATERRLSKLWQAFVSADEILRNDNFFLLGGNSLSALRLASAIEREFGVRLEWQDILVHSTLAEQGRLIERAPPAKDAQTPTRADGSHPLSPAQLQLWQLEMTANPASAYNIATVVELAGALDLEALQSAWQEVAGLHPALRTRISTGPDDRICQRFSATVPSIVVETPQDGMEARLRELADERFDLQDTLVRGHLLTRAEDRHELVIVFHHLIVDAWSTDIILRDLTVGYERALRGASEAQAKSADALGRALARLSSKSASKDYAHYWNDALDGAPLLHSIPLNRIRPSVRTFEGERIVRKIESDRANALRALARDSGTTLPGLLLATFAVFAARVSREQDVVIGVPIADRDTQSVDLVGYFVNTLPVRMLPDFDLSFDKFLAQTRKTLASVIRHNASSFGEIVQACQAQGTRSHNPIYQLCFTHREAPTALHRAGLTFTPRALPTRSSKFDLSLEAIEVADRLTLALEYDCNLFDQETCANFLASFDELLNSIIADPTSSIGGLAMLTHTQHEAVVSQWNDTARSEAPLFMDLFKVWVSTGANGIACRQDSKKLSYGDLSARASVLAGVLQSLGLKNGDRVAMLLDPGPDVLVAIVAAFKAGIAFLPFDCDWPRQRALAILQDAGVKAIITSRDRLKSSPAPPGVAIVSVEATGEPIAATSLKASDAAYVIYTSGSTGKPKGVCISHGALANYVRWAVDRYDAVAGDGAPVVTALAFDATITSLLVPLAAGNTVHFAPVGQAPIVAFAETGRDFSFIKITPTQLDLLADLIDVSASGNLTRRFIVGGEPLAPATVDRWHNLAPECEIVNEYGPTEATVGCSAQGLHPPFDSLSPVPIGRPIDNCRIYVLDELLQPLPPGARGELCIAGAGLSCGYLGAQDQTSWKFVRLPWAQNERIYRTGDLGRWRADGVLEFHGRRDSQVKLRGIRVDLAEIEAALLDLPGITRAAAIVADRKFARQLVGFVVGSRIDSEAACRARIARVLPQALIPARIVNIDTLPVTRNGKIDRDALGKVELAEPQRRGAGAWLSLEREIADLWADTLGTFPTHPEDNFIAAGGNSLLAMKLASKLASFFQISITAGDVLGTTLAGLAVQIDTNSCEDVPAGPAERRDDEVDICSPWQEQIWGASKADPTGCGYNMVATCTVRGQLDLGAFETSVRDLVSRHTSLRLTFSWRDGRLRQTPLPHEKALLFECRRLDDLEDSSLIDSLRAGEEMVCFDLEKGPLVRIIVVERPDRDHQLIFNCHHILADGASFGILMDELWQSYAIALGANATLPSPESLIPAAHARWLEARLDAEGPKLEAYWAHRLAGAKARVNLPYDTVGAQTGKASVFRAPVKGELLTDLRNYCRDRQVTPFAVLLAAWSSLLYRISGQPDLTIATPIDCRDAEFLRHSIGLYVNTVPVRMIIDHKKPLSELVDDASASSRGALANAGLPLAQTKQFMCCADMHMSLNVGMTWHYPLPQIDNVPGLTIESLERSFAHAHADLWLHAEESSDGLALNIEYDIARFEQTTVELLSKRLERLVASIIKCSEISLDEVEFETVSSTPDFDFQALMASLLRDRP